MPEPKVNKTTVEERRQVEDALRRMAGEMGASELAVKVSGDKIALFVTAACDGIAYSMRGQNLDDVFVSIAHHISVTEKSLL